MKCKKLLAVLAAAGMTFSQISTSVVFAQESEIKEAGIIDVSSLTPSIDLDFEDDSWKNVVEFTAGMDFVNGSGHVVFTNGWNMTTRASFTDQIVMFDYTPVNSDRYFLFLNQDVSTGYQNRMYYGTEGERTTAHILPYSKNESNPDNNMMMEPTNGTYYKPMEANHVYNTIVQKTGQKISVFMKDETANEETYTEVGSFDNIKVNETAGIIKFEPSWVSPDSEGAYLDNLKVYDISSGVQIISVENDTVTVSITNYDTVLSGEDFIITDSSGKVVEKSVSALDDGNYQITISKMESAAKYEIYVREEQINRFGCKIIPASFTTDLMPDVYVDFEDDSWKDVITFNGLVQEGKAAFYPGHAIVSKNDYTDTIMEFDATMNGTDMYSIYTNLGLQTNYFNQLYVRNGENKIHRLVNGENSIGDGFLTGSGIAGNFETGNTYRFKIEKIKDTIQVYVMNLTAGESEYVYAGYFQNDAVITTPGRNRIDFSGSTAGPCAYVDNFKIYDLTGKTNVSNAGGTNVELNFSIAPQELKVSDVIFKDITGKNLVQDIEALSATGYKLTLSAPIEAGSKYIVEFSDTVKNVYGSEISGTVYLSDSEPTLYADFEDDSWKSGMTINEGADAVAVENGKLRMMYNWELNTRKMYADAILEFDVCFDHGSRLTITTNQDGGTYNYYYFDIGDGPLRVHRVVDKNGANVVPDGFINGGESIDNIKAGITYRFKIETVGDTVSVYIKKAEENTYQYVGYFQSSDLVQTAGYTKIRFNEPAGIAGTLDNIAITTFDSQASVLTETINPASGAYMNIDFSISPEVVLTNETLFVQDDAGNNKNIAVEALSGRRYRVYFEEDLAENTTYNIAVSDTMRNFYEKQIGGTQFVTGTIDKEIEIISVDTTENGIVSVTVKNAGMAGEAVVLCAVFDGDTFVSVQDKPVAETVSFDIKVEEGQTVKAFVWNSLSGMIPLTAAK